MKSRARATQANLQRWTRTSGNDEPHSTGPTAEEIQLRAYEIYVSRGRIDGQDLDDWFQAEKELREKSRKQRTN